jgi:tetratricopeptide (TPR) repeat protein
LLTESGDQVDAARAAVSFALGRIDAAHFDEAVRILDAAAAHLSGGEAARAFAQRALALQRGGRVVDALEDWDRSVRAFEDAGMAV